MQIHISESIEVRYHVDVAVIGGGPAGIGAAFSAARNGKKVLLIEQTGCLGGISTSGLHAHICCFDSWRNKTERVVGGICFEIASRVVSEGHGTVDGQNFDFETEWLKYTLDNMISETKNIQVLYYTQFSNVVLEDDQIAYVTIQNKSGRTAVKADIYVDATGDGDVSFRAGVPFEKGDPITGIMQPMTMMFHMGGVDHEAFVHFKDQIYPQKYGVSPGKELTQVFLEAQKNGDMLPFQSACNGWWWVPTHPDRMGANFTHVLNKDATNAEDLTQATIEGRKQVYQSIDVFNKYIPGLERAWISHTAAVIGARESRRIQGMYRITVEDLLEEKEFPDSIGYGSFYIDVHNCTGSGIDQASIYPRNGFKYQIPYRALLPKKIRNLLLAGRCISCDRLAFGSLRLMPQCFIEGDAAGAAAAIALDTGVSVRDINIEKLQQNLRDTGSILFSQDIFSQTDL